MQKSMNDLISITIPSYNGEKYIAQCIESIQSQDMPVEILVVDDGSTDRTLEIAQDMGCKILHKQERTGQVASKNVGIAAARGPYWLTIDQDDRLAPGALCALYEAMTRLKNAPIVMAKVKDFCSPDTPEQQRFCKREPFYGILTGSTLFRKSVFDKIGNFREDIITGEVIDLTNRLLKHNIEITKVDFVSCYRRIHDQNYGCTNQSDEYKDYAKMLRERLRVRR